MGVDDLISLQDGSGVGVSFWRCAPPRITNIANARIVHRVGVVTVMRGIITGRHAIIQGQRRHRVRTSPGALFHGFDGQNMFAGTNKVIGLSRGRGALSKARNAADGASSIFLSV